MLAVLNYRVADNLFIDSARGVVIVTGALIVGYILRRMEETMTTLSKARLAFLGVWGAYSTIQEIAQFGKPMLVWRLPLLFAGSCLAIWIIQLMRKAGYKDQ